MIAFISLPALISRAFARPSETKSAVHLGSVQNGTALLSPENQNTCMRSNKGKRQRDTATLASVRKEMAKPRMAESARIAQQHPRSARIRSPLEIVLPKIIDRVKLKSNGQVPVIVTAATRK
jgi:hypothetical protein